MNRSQKWFSIGCERTQNSNHFITFDHDVGNEHEIPLTSQIRRLMYLIGNSKPGESSLKVTLTACIEAPEGIFTEK